MAFEVELKQFKQSFFDRDAVTKAMNRIERKALSKLGAFIRQRAKTSIRNAPMANAETGEVTRGRKKKGVKLKPAISKPGQPPYSHEGSLKRLILFSYDASRRSLIVGPAKFKAGNAPKLVELGGPARLGKKTVTYRPRPFMRPAGEAEVRKFPQLIQSVK